MDQVHVENNITTMLIVLNKLKIVQNKCIRFCIHTGNRKHIGFAEYKKINWLPIELWHQQSVCALVHNFFNDRTPAYMTDIFHIKASNKGTRNSFMQLQSPQVKVMDKKGLHS